jgi:hypothetical protein
VKDTVSVNAALENFVGAPAVDAVNDSGTADDPNVVLEPLVASPTVNVELVAPFAPSLPVVAAAKV